MIPLGYMYKSVGPLIRSDLPDSIVDFHTLGECSGNSTQDFANYIPFFKHNGWGLYNSPRVMQEIAVENNIDLSEMQCFYYEAYRSEFDFPERIGKAPAKINQESWKGVWKPLLAQDAFTTDIVVPETKNLSGFDVVEHTGGSTFECSLIACSDLVHKWKLNSHGLFATFDEAKSAVETGLFHDHEPGPYRIVAVYTLD